MPFTTVPRQALRAARLARPVRLFSTSLPALAHYENVLVSTPEPGVALITLNRPKALKALNAAHFRDIASAFKEADEDPSVGAVVLTGSDRAFAAGADIKEMKDRSFAEAYMSNFLASWEVVSKLNKPVIAAVSGYAVCVFIFPQVLRWTTHSSAVVSNWHFKPIFSSSRTSDRIKADEAEKWGLVSRVVPGVVNAAVQMAASIADIRRVAVAAGEEAVNAAFNLPLAEGLRFERRLFHSIRDQGSEGGYGSVHREAQT
ncbi:putative enoyl-CoA hydratase precursor, mitochondrial [Chiua virens]|nr:putative enoyl-CoA hydratase precursor, mitochondrial [Chiua virens]